jgi:hypothetical protein
MTVPLTGSEPIEEITTSATWFIRRQWLELTLQAQF